MQEEQELKDKPDPLSPRARATMCTEELKRSNPVTPKLKNPKVTKFLAYCRCERSLS